MIDKISVFVLLCLLGFLFLKMLQAEAQTNQACRDKGGQVQEVYRGAIYTDEDVCLLDAAITRLQTKLEEK